MEAKITITRDSPEDLQTRQIVVFLDGKLMAELLFGDEIALPVSPGRHVLRVDNTWNHKDLDVEVSAGDDLHFRDQKQRRRFIKISTSGLRCRPHERFHRTGCAACI
jgi:hypothetical protein